MLTFLNQDFSKLSMFECTCSSHVNLTGIPVYFIDYSEFITGQCKKILSRPNKNEIKCFNLGSKKRALRPHWRTIIAG